MMTKTSSKLSKLIRESTSFLIAGHMSPEGDSMGSTLALAIGLKKMGKKDVVVLSIDPVPETLRFLPFAKSIKQKPPRREFDLLILVDCNTLERTGFESLPARKVAVIDHHVLTANDARSEFYKSVSASLIDPHAAAAGVLVYKILVDFKIPMDKNIATNLYAAILVDTGGFRYSNVSTEPLKIASYLVEAGASPWDITKEVYTLPYKSMKLLGLSLTTVEKKDGIAWMTSTQSMFNKTGTTSEDTEDFVDYPRKIKGTEVAVFFREDAQKSIKLSLRSRGKVDVQKIAKSFGGGGHAAAAGCKLKGALEEVQDKVFRAIRKAIRETRKS
jgi:phosphoesterase RecJ-like protein